MSVEDLCRELLQIAVEDELAIPRGKRPEQQPDENLSRMAKRITEWKSGKTESKSE